MRRYLSDEGKYVLALIFKNVVDVQSYRDYRAIKLMSHTMKIWEERRRYEVMICEQQYGFMPRKSARRNVCFQNADG